MKKVLLYILALALSSHVALAQTATTSSFSLENFQDKHELEYGQTLTKKIIVNYAGPESNIKGSISGNSKTGKWSALHRVNRQRYYFNFDFNATAVGDFKYTINLNDYAGGTSSSSLKSTFNVKVNGLTFEKPAIPNVESTYKDFEFDLPFKFSKNIPINFIVEKPVGFNLYPIQYNDFNQKKVKIRFYVDELKPYRLSVQAKTYEGILLGRTTIDILNKSEIKKAEANKNKPAVTVTTLDSVTKISTPTQIVVQPKKPVEKTIQKTAKKNLPKNQKWTIPEKDTQEIVKINSVETKEMRSETTRKSENTNTPFYLKIFDWFLN